MSASYRLRALRWAMRHIEKPLLARAKHPFWTRVRTEIMGRALLRGRAPFR